MYRRHYGLREHPFNLTPDPRYLYLTPKHREALAHLEYALTRHKGITVLTGEVGTGKTILLRAALGGQTRKTEFRCATIWNPTLTRQEFYHLLSAEFGFTPEAAGSKAQFLVELDAVVRRHHDAGGITAIVVDEAQALSLEILEEIRLLANIESNTEKLLQVVLVGQPELSERLKQPELRQLKQRVALRCALGPLDLQETAAYIAGRIRIAGGEPQRIFSREAVKEVYARTQGIPRLISVICDNALVTGFALGARQIDRRIIVDVCRDFDIDVMARQPVAADSISTASDVGDDDHGSEATSQHPAEEIAPGMKTAEPAEHEPAVVETDVARRFTLFGRARAGLRR